MKIIVGFIIALLILAVLLTLGILSKILSKYVEDRFKYERDYELNMEYFMHSIHDSCDFCEILLNGIITALCIILALIVFYVLGDIVIGA